MRFRFTLPLALALMGMFIFGCQDGAQSAGPTFAVVDMARIFRDSAPGKDCAKFLEGRQKEVQAQLEGLQEKLEKNPADEKAMQELQRVYAVSQQRLQSEQQNVVNILYDTIQRVLNEYRASKGYSAIFTTDGMAVFDPKIDVTTAVIAEVDKQKVDLKSIADSAVQQDASKDQPVATGDKKDADSAPADAAKGTDEAGAKDGAKAQDASKSDSKDKKAK